MYCTSPEDVTVDLRRRIYELCYPEGTGFKNILQEYETAITKPQKACLAHMRRLLMWLKIDEEGVEDNKVQEEFAIRLSANGVERSERQQGAPAKDSDMLDEQHQMGMRLIQNKHLIKRMRLRSRTSKASGVYVTRRDKLMRTCSIQTKIRISLVKPKAT